MKAIVTGALGFIGRNLCEELKKKDWKIWGMDDLSSGKEWNRIDGINYCISTIHNRNKKDEETVLENRASSFQPDVIFHLAAIPRVSYSVEYPWETTYANLMGTLSVLEAARKSPNKCRVVFSSSSSIYGGADELPTPVSYPANPQSPYALQKWQGEEWCRMYASLYDIDVVCLRYFNAHGPHSYYGGAYSTVLSAWLYSLYVDPETRPFLEGDGTQTRDFCAVKNAVQSNILAAEHSGTFHGEAFNIAHGNSHSLLDCRTLLEKISGKKLDIEFRPPRIGDVKHTQADISLSRTVLGYDPDTDFEFQVQEMANWYDKSYRKN